MTLAIGHYISYFQIRKTTGAFSILVKYRSLDKSSPPSRLNASCIFIAFSNFQSKCLAGLWCELRLSLFYESFMLFCSQLFGCIWLGEVWGWPNGEATWRLQMFCFCICTAHQKQQAVPPLSPAIWETPGSRFSCSPVNYWRALLKRYKFFSGHTLVLHSATVKLGTPCC